MKTAFKLINQTNKQIVLAVIASITLPAMVAFNVQPAQAMITDPGVIDQLQNRKRALQAREFYLIRDQDDLLRKREEIKRDPNADSWQLNEVCRKIDNKTWELQQVRLDIRDVNTRLL